MGIVPHSHARAGADRDRLPEFKFRFSSKERDAGIVRSATTAVRRLGTHWPPSAASDQSFATDSNIRTRMAIGTFGCESR